MTEYEREQRAEAVVLEALARQPQFAIEIKPCEGLEVDDIQAAVMRSAAAGWVVLGARSHDPRAHLTAAGRAELAAE